MLGDPLWFWGVPSHCLKLNPFWNTLIHSSLFPKVSLQVPFLPVSKARQCLSSCEPMASFLKHPSVKELAHITSKGVFSSQNQSKHTHKCSLRDRWGREFLKAGHKLIVFLTVPCSQRSGQIPPGLYLRLTTPRNKPGLGAGSRSKSGSPERAGDGPRLENEALETTQKQEAIGFQREQTVQRKALFSCLK